MSSDHLPKIGVASGQSVALAMLLTAVAVAAIGLTVTALLWPTLPSDPVTVSTCPPGSYHPSQAVPVDPDLDAETAAPNDEFMQLDPCLSNGRGTVTLSEFAQGIPIQGQVCSKRDATWLIRVNWVLVTPAATVDLTHRPLPDIQKALVALDPVEVPWFKGCGRPFGVLTPFVWVPSPTLVEMVSNIIDERGQAQVRIAGTGEPTGSNPFDAFAWESVPTFTVVA